jgi:hypothetical protein
MADPLPYSALMILKLHCLRSLLCISSVAASSHFRTASSVPFVCSCSRCFTGGAFLFSEPLRISTFGFRTLLLLSTLNPQPSTLNPQPSTLNPQPSTRLKNTEKTHSIHTDEHIEKHSKIPMKHTKTQKNTLEKTAEAGPRAAAPAAPFHRNTYFGREAALWLSLNAQLSTLNSRIPPFPSFASVHLLFTLVRVCSRTFTLFCGGRGHLVLLSTLNSQRSTLNSPSLSLITQPHHSASSLSLITQPHHSASSLSLITQPRLFAITLFFTLSFPKLLSLCYHLAAP